MNNTAKYEAMNDGLISRRALEAEFRRRADTLDKELGGDLFRISEIIMVIDNAPTVLHDNYSMGYQDGVKKVLSEKPKSQWIPVSERLPEKNMACLVAVGKFNLTQIAMYSDLMGTINHKIFYQGDYGHENFEDITQYVNAWIPLPKSYKEEEDEQ